jgi:hypothetical protein
MKIKNMLLLLFLAVQSAFLDGKNMIYLKNEYKDPVMYQLKNAQGIKEIYLEPQNKHFVGLISYDSNNPKMQLQSLAIKGAGIAGFIGLTQYVFLDKALKGIAAVQKANCIAKKPSCYDDAIIVINASSEKNIWSWDVRVDWFSSGTTSQTKQMDLKTLLMTLKNYITNNNYDATTQLLSQYQAALQKVFSAGQIKTIQIGAHQGADVKQKQLAIKFIDEALKTAGIKEDV